MNLVEFTSLVSAIATVVTLGVLIWYTYETRKIRLDASAQNKLISEQLSVMQESLAFEQHRETQSAKPFLAWRSWGCTGSELYYQFINQGALITNTKVNADGGLEGWFEPADIPTGQSGYLKFRGLKKPQHPDPFSFSIEFTDKLNERRKINYIAPLHSHGDLKRPEIVNN